MICTFIHLCKRLLYKLFSHYTNSNRMHLLCAICNTNKSIFSYFSIKGMHLHFFAFPKNVTWKYFYYYWINICTSSFHDDHSKRAENVMLQEEPFLFRPQVTYIQCIQRTTRKIQLTHYIFHVLNILWCVIFFISCHHLLSWMS